MSTPIIASLEKSLRLNSRIFKYCILKNGLLRMPKPKQMFQMS